MSADARVRLSFGPKLKWVDLEDLDDDLPEWDIESVVPTMAVEGSFYVINPENETNCGETDYGDLGDSSLVSSLQIFSSIVFGDGLRKYVTAKLGESPYVD